MAKEKDCFHSWDRWRPIDYPFDLMQPNDHAYKRECQNMGCNAYQTVKDVIPVEEPITREK